VPLATFQYHRRGARERLRILSIVDIVAKILKKHGSTQAALAEDLSVDASVVSNWLSGKREPMPLQCLLLSRWAENPTEKQFLIDSAKLNAVQMAALKGVLKIAETTAVLTPEARELVSWYEARSTNPYHKGIKEMIKIALADHRTAASDSKNENA